MVTREGRPARVICAYAKGDQPIVALVDIDGNELSFSYYENGRCSKEETPAEKEIPLKPGVLNGKTIREEDSVIENDE